MVAALNIAQKNAQLMKIALNVLRKKREWKQQYANVCNKRTKAKNRIRDRQYALRTMQEMTDFEFERMFRVTRSGFSKLLQIIKPDMERSELRAIASSGSAITDVAALGATLRYLAGGSYLDIAAFFGLDSVNFFNKNYVVWRVFDAINTRLPLGFSLDPEYLEQTAKEFSTYSHGRMKGCVMAIDGWVCKTRQPRKAEVGLCVSSYRNRKHCWGIICLAGCDARCRFNLFASKWSGGTHDYLAWETCAFKKILEEQLPEPYYVIGDEAFVNTDNFLIPWSGRSLGLWKDSYNYHLSAMRQCIERAFGILTKRWGIFWRPLECQHKRWSQVCMVAAKLHNFCIDQKIAMPLGKYREDVFPGDVHEVIMNNENRDGLTQEERNLMRSSGERNTRQAITNKMQLNGWQRPLHARVNSKA